MENAANFFVTGIAGPGSQRGRSTPARDLATYQLMVKLPGSLSERVKAEQDDAVSRYGSNGFAVADPELVLAKFEAREEVEETLLRWLPRIVGQQEAFPVVYNNYGSMPGYPLYVRIQDPAPFRKLSEGLRILDGLLKNDTYDAMQVFTHPRLVITHGFGKGQEMEILLDFSGRSFRAEMIIEELLLVRTDPGKDAPHIVCRLMLSPIGLKRTEID